MSLIHVVYHHEAGSWWAESDDLPGFSALADTFTDTAALVREAVAQDPDVQLHEELDGGGVLLFGRVLTSSTSASWTPRVEALSAEEIVELQPMLQTA